MTQAPDPSAGCSQNSSHGSVLGRGDEPGNHPHTAPAAANRLGAVAEQMRVVDGVSR